MSSIFLPFLPDEIRTLLVVVCCIITFTVTCFSTGIEMVDLGGRWEDNFFWIACSVGTISAGQTGELIMALLWRKKRD